MIDQKLTQQIQQWIATEPKTDEVIIEGANLLLRINRNRTLHQSICRKPQSLLSKLTYELQKHLRYRLDGLTLQEVRTMEKAVLPQIQATIEEGEPVTQETEVATDVITEPKRGRRADHDSLPADIQSLWTTNADRWKKMKEAFATCQGLSMACDRYEYVKMLSETYKLYRSDMAKYDAWHPENNDKNATDTTVNTPSISTQVSSARAYISKNRPTYDALLEDKDADASTLKAKIQQRVDILLSAVAPMSEELIQWLTDRQFSLTLTTTSEA